MRSGCHALGHLRALLGCSQRERADWISGGLQECDGWCQGWQEGTGQEDGDKIRRYTAIIRPLSLPVCLHPSSNRLTGQSLPTRLLLQLPGSFRAWTHVSCYKLIDAHPLDAQAFVATVPWPTHRPASSRDCRPCCVFPPAQTDAALYPQRSP